MSEKDDIKKRAAERGRKMNLPYAGALLPAEAHALMQAGAKLVDVRTEPELAYVGSVPGAKAVEWSHYPAQRNTHFLEELADVAGKDETVMFLCRSGARSHNAAMVAAQAGWNDAYNVLEGFEGDKNEAHHRGTVGGWKFAKLPWVQG